jgi:hydroxymethylbilane synthase
MPAETTVVLGSLASPLARVQSEVVLARLRDLHPDLVGETVVLATPRPTSAAEPYLAAPAAAVQALEEALLAGECDLGVVAAPDLLLPLHEGVVLAAVLERFTPYDGLVHRRGLITEELADGARVGVLNLRTRIQVRSLWPHLAIVQVRGGVDGALEKLLRRGEYEALVLPAASVEHLGIQSLVSEMFSPDMVLPSPGQGILTVLARRDDQRLSLLQPLHSPATHLALEAEQAFAQRFAGDEDLPVAALAHVRESRLLLDGAVLSPSGTASSRDRIEGPVAEAPQLGEQLAERLLLGGDAVLHLLEADFPEGLPAFEEDLLEEAAEAEADGAADADEQEDGDEA